VAVLIHPDESNRGNPQDEEEGDREEDILFDLAEHRIDFHGGISNADQPHAMVLQGNRFHYFKDFFSLAGPIVP